MYRLNIIALIISGVLKFSILTAQPGTLDVNFDGDGMVFTNVIGGSGSEAGIIQSDGKILIGGTASSAFALVRYNPDGSLDQSFDSDGILYSINGHCKSLVMQPDGKIIAAGYSGSGSRFVMARLNSNGTLDNSFSFDGKVETYVGIPASGNSVALQTDGKIVIGGQASNNVTLPTRRWFAVARYNPDGILDNTFDSDGIVLISFPYTHLCNVAIEADGKILVAGTVQDSVDSNYVIALLRYNQNGTLDNTFNTDGIVFTDLGHPVWVTSLKIQSDEKIVIAGSGGDSMGMFPTILARYNPDGSLDRTFNTDGIVDTLTDVSVNALSLQQDGKIVVTGFWVGSQGTLGLLRYNSNGSLDNTFGLNGIVKNGYFDPGTDLSIQPDGKIVVVGNGFSVARFISGLNVGIIEQSTKITEPCYIYPNPIENSAMFEYELIEPSEVSITVLDIGGKTVKSFFKEQREVGKQTELLPFRDLPSGEYFLLLKTSGGSVSVKIVKD